MKEIKLTQGQVALVDDEDYEWLNQWKWYCRKNHKVCYASRGLKENNRNISMHRLIMGDPDKLIVDHIDHNGLNNQKSNLRVCTHSESMMNRRSWGNAGYLGVHICISAQIKTRDKLVRLGTFKTIEDAAKAYDKAAKKYFGEFANLNFKE